MEDRKESELMNQSSPLKQLWGQQHPSPGLELSASADASHERTPRLPEISQPLLLED